MSPALAEDNASNLLSRRTELLLALQLMASAIHLGPQIAPSSSWEPAAGTRVWLRQLTADQPELGFFPKVKEVIRKLWQPWDSPQPWLGSDAAGWEVAGREAWLHGSSLEQKVDNAGIMGTI